MYLYPACSKLTRTITSIICFLSYPGVTHLPSSHGLFFFFLSPCHQTLMMMKGGQGSHLWTLLNEQKQNYLVLSTWKDLSKFIHSYVHPIKNLLRGDYVCQVIGMKWKTSYSHFPRSNSHTTGAYKNKYSRYLWKRVVWVRLTVSAGFKEEGWFMLIWLKLSRHSHY